MNATYQVTTEPDLLKRVAFRAMQLTVGAGLMAAPSSGKLVAGHGTSSASAVVSVETEPAQVGVESFCAAHRGLKEQVQLAERLIRESFPRGARLTRTVESDPECDGSWLVVDVAAPDSAQVLVAAYRAFLEKWLAASPSWADSLLRVTFTPA